MLFEKYFVCTVKATNEPLEVSKELSCQLFENMNLANAHITDNKMKDIYIFKTYGPLYIQKPLLGYTVANFVYK